MEWATRAEGPWHRTFGSLHAVDNRGRTQFTTDVPMFFRITSSTQEPPQGMVWIDAGDLELGQEGLAMPVHTNFISGFWMDEMEVTLETWSNVYQWAVSQGFTFHSAGAGRDGHYPVHNIFWYDCVIWCNARSLKQGLQPCYYTDASKSTIITQGILSIDNTCVDWQANGYRLPTEAEWEKAARGGRQGRRFPWGGDTIQHNRANYNANTNAFSYDTSATSGFHPTYQAAAHPYTSPVGRFPPNEYGLHDMAGNVAEWCWDRLGYYSGDYQVDPHGPLTDPFGPYRVLRGGSWLFTADAAQCAARNQVGIGNPGYADDYIGFRCVKGP